MTDSIKKNQSFLKKITKKVNFLKIEDIYSKRERKNIWKIH